MYPPSVRLQFRLKFLSDLWVRLTFCQMYKPIGEALGQVDIFVRSSGQADLWSDVPTISEVSGQVDVFVRSLGQADLWSDVSPLVRLWVRLTFWSIFGSG